MAEACSRTRWLAAAGIGLGMLVAGCSARTDDLCSDPDAYVGRTLTIDASSAAWRVHASTAVLCGVTMCCNYGWGIPSIRCPGGAVIDIVGPGARTGPFVAGLSQPVDGRNYCGGPVGNWGFDRNCPPSPDCRDWLAGVGGFTGTLEAGGWFGPTMSPTSADYTLLLESDFE